MTSPAPIPGDIAGDVPEATAVTRYDRAPDGTVGDACRRALGLPTPPPPPSTADLWLRLWLEQVVEASAPPGSDARSATWARIAELHPAARRPGLTGDADRSLRLDDPYALAETTLALADRWTWPRLRREPEIVALAGPMVCRQVARWMDDGMFARALLAELPSLAQATLSTSAVLPDAVQQQIDVAIVATGLRWSGGDDTGPEVADQ